MPQTGWPVGDYVITVEMSNGEKQDAPFSVVAE